MHIQINTDHTIEANEALSAHVSSVVESALKSFSEHITRVEVHLNDEIGAAGSHKVGHNDKRCMMEARLEGRHPLAVTAHADSLHQSVDHAAGKLARLVESTLEKQHNHRPLHNKATPDEITLPEAD